MKTTGYEKYPELNILDGIRDFVINPQKRYEQFY